MGTTHFRGNLEVGGSLTTGTLTNSGALTIPSLTTTERLNLTAEAGMHVYDSTLGYDMMYRAAGWGQTGGSAAGSLDAAYNGGSSITVDAGAVTLNDTQTATGGGLLITKSGVITGANSASVFHINSTGAHDTSGDVTFLEISVGAETISGAVVGAEIEMNANTDSALTITKGAATLTDGALTLTAGALLLTLGDLTLTAGDLTMTLGDFDTADGSVTIIDADNANTFAVTNNTITTADLADVNSTSITTGALMKLNANTAAHDGEVLEIISAGDTTSTPVGISVTIDSPTTGAARGIEVVMAAATTTAKGISVTMDAITTGDMLYLDNGGASMTGDGKFINCNDDNVSAFSVSANGATVIAGSASGTDALTLTAGDILVTSGHVDMTVGDFTMADGSVSITDADNAASLTVINNTVTTAAALADVSSTSITTGALMRLNANTAAHDGEVLEIISAGDATSTPVGVSVTIASPTTGAARGIEVTMAGATTTAKGIAVTMDAITTGDMLYLDNGGGTMTAGSGFFINCNDDNASLFSVSTNGNTVIAGTAAGTAAMTLSLGDLVITDTDSTTITSVNGTGSIVEIISGGAIGADKACLEIDAAGTFNADGSLLRLSAEGVTATNSPFAMQIDAAALDMGAINIVSAPTTNSAVVATTTGALAADKAVVELVSNAAACNADSAVLRVEQTATDGVATCVALKQDDLNIPFITFESTIGTGNAIEAVGAKSLTTTHFVMVDIEGVGTRYVQVGTIA